MKSCVDQLVSPMHALISLHVGFLLTQLIKRGILILKNLVRARTACIRFSKNLQTLKYSQDTKILHMKYKSYSPPPYFIFKLTF